MKKIGFICMIAAIVSSSMSCTDDKDDARLQASFTSDKQAAVAGEKVVFYDESTGNPVRWDWEFDGGTPATSQLSSPEVVYSAPGSYKVKLTVGRGEQNSVSEIINYMEISYPGSVTADFTCDITTDPRTCLNTDYIQFTDLSTGVPSEWLWTFTPDTGTPINRTEQNPRLQLAAGNYTISLRVSNPNATAHTETKTDYIRVIDPYDVSADFTSPCPRTYAGGPGVSFTDTSLGLAESWNWEFEGGSPSSSIEQNPTGITYAAAGRYKVKLTVSNSQSSHSTTKEGYVVVVPANSILLYFPLCSDANDIGPNKVTPEIVMQGGGTITYPKDSWQAGTSAARFITTDADNSANNPVGGFLSIPSANKSLFNGSQSFSISLWSKSSNTAAVMHLVHMGIGITGTSTSNQTQAWFRYDTNASYYVRFAVAVTGMAGNWTDYKTRMTDGKWHHYVIVRERDAEGRDDSYIYIDGVQVASALNKAGKNIEMMPYTIGASHVLTGTAPFALDRYQQWLIGSMSDYIHWGRALSAAEVQSLYKLYVKP